MKFCQTSMSYYVASQSVCAPPCLLLIALVGVLRESPYPDEKPYEGDLVRCNANSQNP